MKTGTYILMMGLAGLSAAALADDGQERALKQFFEGRMVTVLVDMPATSKGIDVEMTDVEPINPSKVNGRISESGLSLRRGARVPITEIALKKDLIEIHLAGGGFKWFWQGQGAVSPVYQGKSRREKELEDEIKHETDSRRKRHLEDDLRHERRLREEEERRSRDIAERENEMRREEDAERALSQGSRFNIRYKKHVPPSAATPRGVMEALARWVDFSGLPGGDEFRPPRESRPDRYDDRHPREADGGVVRTGMTWDEVKDILGSPDERETSRQDDLKKVVATYNQRRHPLEVTFVNDVVVRVRDLDGNDR
jgi:hypothetical protein